MDRSPMKDHPLTPMKEADLVIHLSYQTKRKVGLADYTIVRKGAKALRKKLKKLAKEGEEIIVVDAIVQRNINTIAEATWDQLLVTGSSGLAMELPSIWRREGIFTRAAQDLSHIQLREGVKPLLVLAGSVSVATTLQNQYALHRGFHGIKLETSRLVHYGEGQEFETELDRVTNEAVYYLSEGRNVLVYSAFDEDDVSKTKALGYRKGLSDVQIGDLISEANGKITRNIFDRVELNKLIVAGGETANSVGRNLNLLGLYVGQQIHPGVPACFAIGGNPKYSGFIVVLKSGNFGKVNFYEDALAYMRRYLQGEKHDGGC